MSLRLQSRLQLPRLHRWHAESNYPLLLMLHQCSLMATRLLLPLLPLLLPLLQVPSRSPWTRVCLTFLPAFTPLTEEEKQQRDEKRRIEKQEAMERMRKLRSGSDVDVIVVSPSAASTNVIPDALNPLVALPAPETDATQADATAPTTAAVAAIAEIAAPPATSVPAPASVLTPDSPAANLAAQLPAVEASPVAVPETPQKQPASVLVPATPISAPATPTPEASSTPATPASTNGSATKLSKEELRAKLKREEEDLRARRKAEEEKVLSVLAESPGSPLVTVDNPFPYSS